MKKPSNLPEHISEAWDELIGSVQPRIGAAGLEMLCSQLWEARVARERIEDEGIIIQDPKGNPAPHPAIEIEKKAQSEVRAWLKSFGAVRHDRS